MPIPRDSLARIRTSLETLRGHAADTDTVYARALLERAQITENYYVEQEISKNRATILSKDPSEAGDEESPGRIEMAIPYDGYDYFTRQARDDVARKVADQERREPRPLSAICCCRIMRTPTYAAALTCTTDMGRFPSRCRSPQPTAASIN